jgi:hypothetical protein
MPEDPSISSESQSSENSEHSSSEPASGATASAKPTPPPPKPPVSVRVELSSTDKMLGQISKTAKESWKKAQPILKDKSIQALRASNRLTNSFLDHTWPKISAQAIAAIPAPAKTKIEAQKAKIQPTLDKLQPIWEKGMVPFWQKVVVPLWMKGIAVLKTRLPEPLAQELTDRFLTVAVLGLLVVVYWFFSSLTSGQPTVAKQPTFPKPTAAPVITRRPVSPPLQSAPKAAPTISAKPLQPLSPAAKPAAPAATAQPSLPPVAPVSPAATTPPRPTALANPTLGLAEVKAQLSSAVENMNVDLIAAVRSLESDHRLQATLGAAWFGLTTPDQDRVANALWERSQALKFDKFELRDDAGDLIARSPAVGSKVIILKRKDLSGNA